MNTFEKLTLAGNAIGVIVVAGTVWYAARGVRLQAVAEERSLAQSRFTLILDFQEKFNTQYVTAFANLEAVAARRDDHPQEPVQDFLARDTTGARETSVMQALNFFESLGWAVTSGYADNRIACETFRIITDRYYSTLTDWLGQKRRAGRGWSAETYVVFDSLQKRWAGGCHSG